MPAAFLLQEVKEPGRDWCTCNWRNFDVELRCAATQGRSLDGLQLRLRAPVDQLRSLWQRRLEVGMLATDAGTRPGESISFLSQMSA